MNFHIDYVIYGPQREKTCIWGFANNKGADQPAHLRSLISAFVIRFLESIICKLATDDISFFQLVSVAETGLKLALSDTPKTGLRQVFSRQGPYDIAQDTCIVQSHYNAMYGIHRNGLL